MKKLGLKLAIGVLDHLEEKVKIDFNADDVNDLTSAKLTLMSKLEELDKK